MAKNTQQIVQDAAAATGGTAGAALAAAADDWRKLARPVERKAPEFQPLMRAGHNVVLDRSQPDAISLHIATDEEAIAGMLQRAASKAKLKEDPKAVGPRLLAATDGPMWGSLPLDIGGQRFYLKMTLEAARGE